MFGRPVVLLSKCIEHDSCRYDGSMIKNSFIKTLENYVDFIVVCPEKEIGLGVPRESIRIIKKEKNKSLVFSKSGKDITQQMIDFGSNYSNELKNQSIHGVILKSRSPSCGIKDVKIYNGIGKSSLSSSKTSGFFGEIILNDFQGIAIEDEGRLRNYNIRDQFLKRIFITYSFDQVKKDKTMKNLIDFHSKNKYLLMTHNQEKQKELGKIVASYNHENLDDIVADYEILLREVLATEMLRGKNINMLMHLLGYFKKVLKKEEKMYFLDILDQYSDKKIPFSVPLAVLASWVVRFDEPYLKNQTIFKPYPKEIIEVTDSGKGLD